VTLLRGVGDHILGYITVDSPTDGRVPGQAMIEALELAESGGGRCRERASLQRWQQRIKNLTLFNEVGRSISASWT
jgi:hypothetical protein